MQRIPFISSGKLFKTFFELESTTPMSATVSVSNSFDKALFANDLTSKSNPFMSDRRLTESVPPKTTRMTLQPDVPTIVQDQETKDDR